MQMTVKSLGRTTPTAQAKRDRWLRGISIAMARNPRAGFQEIAAAAGISRATLYRIASSREELLMRLTELSAQLVAEAIQQAGLSSKEPETALHDLTAIFMQEDQFYLHVVVGSPEFSPKLVAPDTPPDFWSFYNDALVDLFKRGQQEGRFRTDLPAHWFRWMYDALLLAAVTADLNGELAPVDRTRFVMQAFLRGASTQSK